MGQATLMDEESLDGSYTGENKFLLAAGRDEELPVYMDEHSTISDMTFKQPTS